MATQQNGNRRGGNSREHAKSKGKGRNKTDKPTDEELEIKDFWKANKASLKVRDYRWRIVAFKGNAPKAEQHMYLDSMVTNLTWEDALIQKANFSLTNPHDKLNLLEGHKITVFYSVTGRKWRKLWTLRVNSVTATAATKTYEIEASDEMDWLKKSKDDFAYRKGEGKSSEKRVHGWTADQITRDICKRYGVKIGKLVKGTKRINKLIEKNTDPLSVIEKAYEAERKETGFKYVIAMRQGRLSVTRLRRSRELLIYGGTALDATVTRRLKEKMATELTVTGKVKEEEGEATQKKEITVSANPKVRRRYGYIHSTYESPEPVESVKELRKEAKKELLDLMEPEREVTLTVPGYPGLRRGDAIKVALRDEHLVELMYVTGATHTVSGGDYTTDLTLSFDEFYIDKEGEATREKICKKAKDNGRKAPWFCDEDADVFAPAKQTKKNRNKADDGHKKQKKKKAKR